MRGPGEGVEQGRERRVEETLTLRSVGSGESSPECRVSEAQRRPRVGKPGLHTALDQDSGTILRGREGGRGSGEKETEANQKRS